LVKADAASNFSACRTASAYAAACAESSHTITGDSGSGPNVGAA
jgi:hypothetical protein